MTRYIETIRLEDGRLHLLQLHQQRMARTISEVFGRDVTIPLLIKALNKALSDGLERSHRSAIDTYSEGLYKCRVVYDTDIRQIEIEPYTPRTIRTLKIVTASSFLDYHLKSEDRSALTSLSSQKGTFDEVIIVRDGLITDTSYSNIIFKTPKQLLTPYAPLLAGTMRQHLMDNGLVTPYPLTVDDILPGNRLGITHALLINAMMPLDRAPSVPISEIYL